jgi:hypothetical protein
MLQQLGGVDISFRSRRICLQSDLNALYISVIIVSDTRYRGSRVDKVTEGAFEINIPRVRWGSHLQPLRTCETTCGEARRSDGC